MASLSESLRKRQVFDRHRIHRYRAERLFVTPHRLANRELFPAKRLLLSAALLNHSGDMKPCNIGMAVVI